MSVASRPPRGVPSRGGAPRKPARPARAGVVPRPAGAATAARTAAPPAAPRRPPSRRPPTVSPTSADRFAARVRARRRRRTLVVVLVLLLAGGLGWLTLRSPWATVDRVEVSGTHRIPVETVRAEAEPEVGHSMLLARTGDIEERIARQTLVKSVTVKRVWPSRIAVTVVERVPVAAVPDGGQLALVDDDGVVVERVAKESAALPVVQVGLGSDGVPALRGCLTVLAEMPSDLRGRISTIGARSGDGIHLTLKGGARVEWGSAAGTPRKAEVLTALLKQKADRYDVRAPDAPAVS